MPFSDYTMEREETREGVPYKDQMKSTNQSKHV
jgi:hypothetical protein